MADFKELLCITPQIKMDSSIEACETMCGVYECWRVLTPTVRAEIFYEHTSELHKKRIEKAVGSAHMELQVAEFKAKAFGKQLEEFKLESRKKIEEKDEEIFKIQTHVEWLEELAYKIDAIEIIESSDDDETLPEAQNKPLLDSESSDESNFNEQDQANASLDNEEEYSQKVLNQEIINVDSSSDEDETVPGPHQNIFLQNFQCQVL